MSEKRTTVTYGPGFLGLLTLLFIGLKLGGVIDWTWTWVLAPLWGPLVIFLFVVGLVACGIFLAKLTQRRSHE